MDGARVHLLTDQQLQTFARDVARAAVREVLAEVGGLLPPFTQHALPPDCRRKDFLAAIAAGCPHRKRGRIYEVARADWTTWRAPRPPVSIDATPPPAANDANSRPGLRALDIDALTEEALR